MRRPVKALKIKTMSNAKELMHKSFQSGLLFSPEFEVSNPGSSYWFILSMVEDFASLAALARS